MVSSLAKMAAVSGILGVGAGFLFHRSSFCLAASFRDIFLFRRDAMMRALAVAFVLSALLFEALRLSGLLVAWPFPVFGPPSLAAILGGVVFGVGMVLAGGCVVGTLVNVGNGMAVGLASFVGIIVGSGIYAEIHPAWAKAAAAMRFGSSVTLPQALGIAPSLILLPFLVVVVLWLRRGAVGRKSSGTVTSLPRGYIHPQAAAAWLGVIGGISAVAISVPLGVSTMYAKIAGWMTSVVAPEHFASLPFYRSTPFRVIDPSAGILFTGGPGPVLDAVLAKEMPLLIGVVAGTALSALLVGEFHLRNAPHRQLALALVGGVLMGVASRMSAGCNIIHLLGGVPILAMQSLLFAAGLFPGAWLGGRIVSRTL